jgi:hypothetical protein
MAKPLKEVNATNKMKSDLAVQNFVAIPSETGVDSADDQSFDRLILSFYTQLYADVMSL